MSGCAAFPQLEKMSPQIRSSGVASVLAIGTELPSNVCEQAEFADAYFENVDCNEEKNKVLKAKLKMICERSAITTRHFHRQPKLVQSRDPDMPLTKRFALAGEQVSKLMSEAAKKALDEWGQPASMITHLVVSTITGVEAPGVDFKLVGLLGLPLDVKRVMLYFGGCSAGAASLRVAKDLAENNPGSRVLVCCCEMASWLLDNLQPEDLTTAELVSSALFGDGAGSVVVGSNPVQGLEKPLFEVHWSMQKIIPNTPKLIGAEVGAYSLEVHLGRDVPSTISKNISASLGDLMLKYSGCASYNDMFWVVHPGGKAVIDALLEPLALDHDKVKLARKVLSECGNLSSAIVLFVLDETRRNSKLLKKATTVEGLEWGAMLAFGPGVTVEALLLKSCVC